MRRRRGARVEDANASVGSATASVGSARILSGAWGAPRSSYVAGTPTPGKMSLFIGSYCFHSCPAQDVLVEAPASRSERGTSPGVGEDAEGT